MKDWIHKKISENFVKKKSFANNDIVNWIEETVCMVHFSFVKNHLLWQFPLNGKCFEVFEYNRHVMWIRAARKWSISCEDSRPKRIHHSQSLLVLIYGDSLFLLLLFCHAFLSAAFFKCDFKCVKFPFSVRICVRVRCCLCWKRILDAYFLPGFVENCGVVMCREMK